jgi:hypothetical protein
MAYERLADRCASAAMTIESSVATRLRCRVVEAPRLSVM